MPAVPAQPSRRKAGRPTRSAEPAVAEEELLAVAFQAFATHGFEATSMRDIAARLGISHTLIHWRFGSKEDLWRRSVDMGFRRALGVLEPVYGGAYPNAVARLRDLVRKFCALCWTFPETVNIMTMEAQQESWRLDHLYAHHVGPFERGIETVLAAVAREQNLDNVHIKAFLALMVHGAGGYFARRPLLVRDHPGVLPTQLPAAEADILADLLVAGLLADGRGGQLPLR